MDKSTGTISIAMEFCEGGSLDSIYREVKKLGGRTGEKVLGKVAEGVLNGLTYLHGRKIIHRGMLTACVTAPPRHETITNARVQISSHPTFSYAGMVRSNSAILVSVVSLARRGMPTPSSEPPTIWPQNVSPVNHTPLPPTCGRWVSRCWRLRSTGSLSRRTGRRCNRARVSSTSSRISFDSPFRSSRMNPRTTSAGQTTSSTSSSAGT